MSKTKSKPKPKPKTKAKPKKPVIMPNTVAWGAQQIGLCIDRSEEQTRRIHPQRTAQVRAQGR